MKISHLPKEFIKALPVLEKLQQKGYEAYFVGGSVRDILLDKPIHDVDIATSAFPSEIKEIFPRTVDVGIEHGTVLVLFNEEEYEITTFRTESTYQDYRRPDKVEFVRSLKEDLKRRDFTINALALNVNKEIIDEFDGQNDLKNRKIRAVGSGLERFFEDALRMMRAARFASQLDFEIEEETFLAMKQHAQLLEKISVERITIEFIKLMQGKNRKRGLMAIIESNAYLYLPQLTLKNKEALLRLAGLPSNRLIDEAQIWALVAFILGLKKEEMREFLRAWKESNAVMKKAMNIFSAFQFRTQHSWNQVGLYKYTKEEALLAEELRALFMQEYSIDSVLSLYEKLSIHSKADLMISGKDILTLLNEKPGAWLGVMLNQIESLVVQGELMNEREILLAKVHELSQSVLGTEKTL
ncbi:MAG: CCA tRNA nucleotidyltransferase [Streptococcaceae bacterium]|nr:CCA tRNA nucleotidyltransferase [Streptococcaceae bacterium]